MLVAKSDVDVDVVLSFKCFRESSISSIRLSSVENCTSVGLVFVLMVFEEVSRSAISTRSWYDAISSVSFMIEVSRVPMEVVKLNGVLSVVELCTLQFGFCKSGVVETLPLYIILT